MSYRLRVLGDCEKAGIPLGQAGRLIAGLPHGAIQDVLPTTNSTPNNVARSITDKNGTTNYNASDLFGASLFGNKGFTSTIYPIDPADVEGFGIDSSLTARPGWDNATGFGTRSSTRRLPRSKRRYTRSFASKYGPPVG